MARFILIVDYMQQAHAVPEDNIAHVEEQGDEACVVYLKQPEGSYITTGAPFEVVMEEIEDQRRFVNGEAPPPPPAKSKPGFFGITLGPK